METKELLLMAEAIANANSIEKKLVFNALEEALALATRKQTGYTVEVKFNDKNAEFKTFRLWQVVAENKPLIIDDKIEEFNPDIHIYEKDSNGVAVGDFVREEIPPMRFDRIGAQVVKQAVVQKVREAEKNSIIARYNNKIGDIISCVVKRITKNNVIVDLGGVDGFVAKNQLIFNEQFRKNDRIKVLVKEIKDGVKGKQLVLSRVDNLMLKALFNLEVPEIAEGAIEVMACARDAGVRSKIAIKARDRRIDAIGACIGMRGTRIQAVSNELNGEKIDIVLWDNDQVNFVVNAIAPAVVSSVTVNKYAKSMDLLFSDEELAKAIGKSGQNINLASSLTGWRLNAVSENDANKVKQDEKIKIIQELSASLDVDEKTTKLLIDNGFDTIDNIVENSVEDIVTATGVSEDLVTKLQAKAIDVQLISTLGDADSSAIFLSIEGIDNNVANALIDNNIKTLENLAELSTDEFLDIYPLEKDKASKIILIAREKEGWFN